MSYFDDASLVMIPSGYKTSKVYSVKPADGTGDLTFTRSNDTATRVGPDGLIEKVRTQLLEQTAFSNAYWTKRGFTLNSSTATAPDGTATATQITEDNTDSNPALVILNSPAYSNPTNFSVWIKASTATSINLSTQGAATGVSISLTTSWQKFSVSQTISTPTGPHIGGFASIAQGSGLVLYVWQPMWEFGDVATDYFSNSTGSPLSVGPVANVPRLDYLNSSCPRLLLEPQRQNVITFSEQIDNAAWTKEGITISANATTSPDGYTNADKLVASASAGDKFAAEVLNVTNGVAYTTSAYFKAAEYTYAFMRLGGTSGNPYVIYNLATQAVVSTFGLTTSTITSVGNGWYRITATATQTSTTLAPVLMVIPSTGYTLGGDNIVEFTGNGTSGGFIWGCQSEAGAYATSYIPTLGAAVTRGLERALKSSVSSLIGQSAGTLYGEFTFDSSETVNRVFSITGADWNTDGSIRLDIISNKPEIYARKAAVDIGSQGSINYTISKGQTIKWALVYTASTMKLFIDGAQRGTTTSLSTTPPACSELFVNELGGGFSSAAQNNQRTLWSQVLLFTSALSDADAAALTA